MIGRNSLANARDNWSPLSPAIPAGRSLTSYEVDALGGPFNLSDGHLRQLPSRRQSEIIASIPALFDEARRRSFEDIETEVHERFFSALGQHAAPVGTGRVLSCYASSVAIDIVARALRTRTGRVAMLHPTFDNIPDLLRGWGHELVPVSQEQFDACSPEVFATGPGCVFVTTPNNPTGWVQTRDGLTWLAGECAIRGVILALDTSFRGFDPGAWFDSYQVLKDSGVDWIVIEDSGKLWPVQDFKAGFLAFSESDLPLKDAFSDLILTVSPVILALIGLLAQDAAAGGFGQMHDTMAVNRAAVRAALAKVGLAGPPDQHSRVSVERIRLPGGTTSAGAYERLRERGLHVLPCDPFHWNAPAEGSSFIRVALGRDPDMLRTAAGLLASVLAASVPAEGAALCQKTCTAN